MKNSKIYMLLFLTLFSFERVKAEGLETRVSGSARFRYEDSLARNPLSADRVAYSTIRLRPNISFNSGEQANFVLEPQFAKIMGSQTYVPTGSAANSLTDTSGNSSYPGDAFNIFQAYIELKSGDYSMLAGRQILKYADEYILGTGDWGVYGRSFDVIKVKYSTGKNFIDIFDAKLIENTAANSSNGGDKDLLGLYGSWEIGDFWRAFDAYYFYLSDMRDPALAPADTGRPAIFTTHGIRWVAGQNSWTWKFEFAQNGGHEGTSYIAANENSKNNMFDTELGFVLDQPSKSRFAVEIFQGGENWRDLFPTTAKVLGRTDVLGRRNLSGLSLKYSTMASDSFGYDLDIYAFQRTSDQKAAYATDSKTAVGSAATSTSKDVGSEVNLVGKYLASKNLTWSLGLNVFMPGAFIKDNQAAGDSGRKTTYSYLMAEAKF